MRLNVLSFAIGVVCLQSQPALPDGGGWLLGVGVAGLGALLVWARQAPGLARQLAGILLCAVLGFGWAAWRAEVRLVDHLAADWEGRDVEVVGTIAGLPQDFSQGVRFEFSVEQALTPGAVIPQRIMLSAYAGRQVSGQAPPFSPRAGERWRLMVRLKRPHGNANPGAFDYEAWLLERGIRATGYVRPELPERLSPMVWTPDHALERLRQQIRSRFLDTLPTTHYPWGGIMVALAVGDQKAVAGEWWTVFNRTGVTHALSISGLHVTMVAALFGWLVSALWRRVPGLALRCPAQSAGLLAATLAAAFYAALSGFAVPAQRTLYMLAVVMLAVFSGRVVAPSQVLALALGVVLVVDPWAVLSAGFWLSFGAVAALLYIGTAEVGAPRSGWGRVRNWGMVQWAATLASMPILLLLFQQLSLVSPLANAVAIPVISFVLTPLVLLAVLLPWPPILFLAHGLFDLLMQFLIACAEWPVWQVSAPPLWAAVLAAIGGAVCLLPRGVPGRWMGGVLLLPALWSEAPRPDEGEVWLNVLDVGQGLASVVMTRRHVLVYDPGPLYSAESDAGQRVVVPYLRRLGVDRVDMLVVTHRDADHSGGMASVLSALPVSEVRASYREAGGQPCEAGQRWTWDDVGFEILHPSPGQVQGAGKANHVSCVLRVTAGGKRVLLTSDIEAPDEAALLARYPDDLAADVLLVPHHGSKTSSTPAFIKAVSASQVIIPVGYRSRFGHPKPEVVARYGASGARVWRTDADGAVDVRMSQRGVAVSGWRHVAPRYWHGR